MILGLTFIIGGVWTRFILSKCPLLGVHVYADKPLDSSVTKQVGLKAIILIIFLLKNSLHNNMFCVDLELHIYKAITALKVYFARLLPFLKKTAEAGEVASISLYFKAAISCLWRFKPAHFTF